MVSPLGPPHGSKVTVNTSSPPSRDAAIVNLWVSTVLLLKMGNWLIAHSYNCVLIIALFCDLFHRQTKKSLLKKYLIQPTLPLKYSEKLCTLYKFLK